MLQCDGLSASLERLLQPPNNILVITTIDELLDICDITAIAGQGTDVTILIISSLIKSKILRKYLLLGAETLNTSPASSGAQST